MTNDVLYHLHERKPLQDVLTCIREGCTIEAAGFRLQANAERDLKSPRRMHELFADWPEALAATIEIADACRFSLDELRYEYPEEIVEPGLSAFEDLRRRTWAGAARRFPAGIPEAVRKQILHELKLVEEREYAPYFLTVHEIVKFAAQKGILHQGRGSAANSVICYCLDITQVDPVARGLLFERFISDRARRATRHRRRFRTRASGRGNSTHLRKVRAGIAQDLPRRLCITALVARVREVGRVLGLSVDVHRHTGRIGVGLERRRCSGRVCA